MGTVSDNTITNDKLATAPTLISKGAGGEGGAIQLNCEVNTHGVKIKKSRSLSRTKLDIKVTRQFTYSR